MLSYRSDGKVLVCRCQVLLESGRCSTQWRRTLDTRCSGAALAKVRGRGLDWGCIVVLVREFFFRELLFYCSVARLQWRDGVSSLPNDGDGARVVREAEAHGGMAWIGPCVTSGDVA